MALIEIAGRLSDALEFADSEHAPAAPRTRGAAPAARGAGGFEPIGIGRPLTIAIEHIYPGRLPGVGTLLKHQPDVLVTSAAKAFQQFDAAPRAINLLAKKVEERKPLPFAAVTDGTPLVYYRDAMADETTTVTVELVADSFPKEAVEQISKFLGLAAQIPVFAPANAYLLAGSVVAKVVGGLGEKLIDGRPFFSANLPIRFDTPGWESAQPRKALLNPTGTDGEFAGYAFPESGYELQKGGVPYKGDVPYVALRIDGTPQPSYQDFAPRAASSALITRFFHLDQGGDAAESVLTVLGLYSDLQFADRAQDVKKKMGKLPAGDPARANFEKLYEALLKNIRDERFKPTAPPA